MLGVCLEREPLCLLFEFMSNGDLRDYLRHCRPEHFILRRRSLVNADSDDSDAGGTPQLRFSQQLHIARQIADALVYLSGRGYVHRDVAARNCLVSADLTVKLSDFGLTVTIPAGQEYHQGDENEAIAIRWMPPESILYNRFTPASDVWSYGILLWEVFSYGSEPYSDMSLEEVVRYVREGNVLYCPETATSDVYQLMQRCWLHDATLRPPFGVLLECLYVIDERRGTLVQERT